MSLKKNNQTIRIISTGIILFLIILTVIYFLVVNSSSEELLYKTADKMNQSLPTMIDDETRGDSASVKGKEILLFHYTLINYEKEDLDTESIKKQFKPILLYNLKQSNELIPLKKNKITFGYTYKDKNKNEVFTFYLTPEMYK